MLIKGSVNAIAYSKGVTLSCFNKYVAINGAVIKTKKIKTRLKSKIKKREEKTIFLLRTVLSLTSLEMLIGRAKEARVINKLKVGVTIVYKLIPSSPITLVYKTRITKLRIFVINPRSRRIIIDVLKVSFFNIHLSYSFAMSYNI